MNDIAKKGKRACHLFFPHRGGDQSFQHNLKLLRLSSLTGSCVIEIQNVTMAKAACCKMVVLVQ